MLDLAQNCPSAEQVKEADQGTAPLSIEADLSPEILNTSRDAFGWLSTLANAVARSFT